MPTEMMRGSFHPLSQLGPCVCGSGDAYVDCCLAEAAAHPFPCGSGTTFADCCRVPTGTTR